MPFTGEEDHSISLGDAAQLTKNYRTSAGAGAVLGGYFSKAALEGILSQDGNVGIRVYFAQIASGTKTIVLVGVNEDGEDLTEGEIAEHPIACPPYCPVASELNGTA